MTRAIAPTLALTLVALSASTAVAQIGRGQPPYSASADEVRQVFSTNPIGLWYEFYNFEYEVKVAESVTAGAGASRRGWFLFNEGATPRLNGDVFVRYYLGQAFHGTAFGVKVGGTRQPDGKTYPGFGFDVNQSLVISDHLVLSSGIGSKRLIGHRKTFGLPEYVTTFRMNVGFAF